MLLREDVVLRRAARVPPAAGRRDVGVGGQGVGGCCLGGHAFLFRVDWRMYLARRATDDWLLMDFFYDFAVELLRFHGNPLREHGCVRWQ